MRKKYQDDWEQRQRKKVFRSQKQSACEEDLGQTFQCYKCNNYCASYFESELEPEVCIHCSPDNCEDSDKEIQGV